MDYKDYQIIEELGEGGNATVFRAEDSLGLQVALKKLVNKGRENKQRFENEIHVLKEWHEKINGIMPIYDYSEKEYWYTMPIAISVLKYIKDNDLKISQIIDYFIGLCHTMSELHKNNVFHRDIKPDNIYFYNGRFYIGDFGLVDFPDNDNNLTRSDRGLGAIFTIAPEMKRDPARADGKKADVYSLAKTLWMLLSLNEKGFDGQYNYFDATHAFSSISSLKKTHTIEIEELISDSTSNDPNSRPSVEEFINRLENWKSVTSNYDKQQKSQWAFLNKHILHNPGESITWRNRDEIVEILNKISAINAYNHMFLPDGGGQDFVSAKIAPEYKGIEIWDDVYTCNIVFPKALHLETFHNHEEWNYFILELRDMKKCFDSAFYHEQLVEDKPGHYVEPTYCNYGAYDYEKGNEYPKGWRLVSRYTGGKFLFVLKNGPYNHINETYDARHNDCSCEQFRDYINELIKKYEEGKFAFFNSRDIVKNPFITEEETASTHSLSVKDIFHMLTVPEDDLSSFIVNLPALEKEFANKYAKFYISFELNDGKVRFDSKEIRLCSNGHLRNLEQDAFDDVLFFNSREKAHEIKKLCQKQLFEYREKTLLSYFSVNIIGISKPEHLFTKDEIADEMKKADDRLNNTLVIDEEGYARIVRDDELDVHSFPVNYEKWIAGNRYVGKYSNLSTLEETYLSSLQGWLRYLQTKQSIHVDYLEENQDEQRSINEIRNTELFTE